MFALLPLALAALIIAVTLGGANFFYDFTGDLYNAGRAILHGRDPYEAAFLAHLASLQLAGGAPAHTFAVPVYPAPALLVVTPLALLGARAAGLIFTLLAIGAMLAGLRLLGVRDWRCYGAAFLSWPLLHSLRLGQLNEFLVLGAGVAWHWRARVWPAAVALASLVAAKLFLWPLGVWLLASGRWRTGLLAVALAAGATIAAWAAIGFDGLSAYPRMLSDLSAVEGAAGVSLISVAAALSLSRATGDLLTLLVTAGLLAGVWWWARAGARAHTSQANRRERCEHCDGDRRAFGLAVMAALCCSPIVWPHYLTLVFVPIALLEPALSVLWLVPLLAYLAPVELTGGDIFKMLPYLAIELIVVASLCVRDADPVRRRRIGVAHAH
ncbi:MAG: glycosyltransferase family 87 protein [Solirubrobacteraceae bacterium]